MKEKREVNFITSKPIKSFLDVNKTIKIMNFEFIKDKKNNYELKFNIVSGGESIKITMALGLKENENQFYSFCTYGMQYVLEFHQGIISCSKFSTYSTNRKNHYGAYQTFDVPFDEENDEKFILTVHSIKFN